MERSAGKFTVEVWETGAPQWVIIRTALGGELRGIEIEDLHDLKHLIERTLATVRQR